MTASAPCPGCGLAGAPAAGPTPETEGRSPGCWAVFSRVVADEYADPARWPVHALTVSAYGAQHPGPPTLRSARTVGVHLVTVALVAERGLPVERAARVRTAASERLTEGMTWLAPPAPGGAGTIASVADAPDADTHRRRVRAWADEVWASWSAHHDTIHRWIDWLVAASPPDFAGALPRAATPPRRSNGHS